MPSIIGAPPINITHLQSSIETSRTYLPILPTTKIPTFAAAPIIPASNGLETLDHASLIKATPLGHMPPTPIHTIKRAIKSCQGD